MSDEKFLIHPLNDPNSKKISQVLANETSRRILGALCNGPLSATQVSETLDIPLTTLHYNIENLIEVGLIKVARTRYSEKGREVKYYEPTRKFIVIAPEGMGKEEVKGVLKKLLFTAYFLIASAFSGYGFQKIYQFPLEGLLFADGAGLKVLAAPEPAGKSPVAGPEPYLWFLLGAIFALFLLFIWRKIAHRIGMAEITLS